MRHPIHDSSASARRQSPQGRAWVFLLAFCTLPFALHAQPLTRHEMQVVLQPEAHRLQVTDVIILPATAGDTWQFRLHAGLQPVSPTPGVRVVWRQDAPAVSTPVPVASYTVRLPPGRHAFELRYAGDISHPLQQGGSAYARSFHGTPGTIAPDGVYLSATSFWYPRADDALLRFSLEVQLPPTWDAVSQGRRTRHERRASATYVRWESPQPQEQIYLVGGTLTEYHQAAGAIQAMVFLRTPDPPLAQKYLEVTGQYVAMYSDLIGPYPYPKFALVENFWESGYGMPSFTLLGSRVIRFPFILHSSYPHEILHNWWGNGVFVEAAGGNWSEGLTAYLADHLVKEQRGTAVAYRRTALQRYTDYVSTHRDFPLIAFRARHDAVTQAIGYDKTLMFFHMLRRQIGDQRFTRALQRFFRQNRFRRAGFGHLQRAFAAAAGTDLQIAFHQWVTRAGAPELRIEGASVRPAGSDYGLQAVLRQAQPGPAYHLRVPVAVTLEHQARAYQTTVVMRDKRLDLALRLPARPLRLDVDPQFDVFRRLHHDEIPPALSQMFGAEKVMVVLPSAATDTMRQAYRQLALSWQRTASGRFDIRWDHEITALPTDRAVWLYGWENRWRSSLTPALSDYDVEVHADTVRLHEITLRRTTHTVVLTGRHPADSRLTLGWIATPNPAALPGLGRKLPHYGKYSYLGFTGAEPTNRVKGQWAVVRSPMSVLLPQPDGRVVPVARARLASRQPLASLPAGIPRRTDAAPDPNPGRP